MNVIGKVVPMFLDNTQTNSILICVLSENIGTTEPITFIYGSICSLHSWEGFAGIKSFIYSHNMSEK